MTQIKREKTEVLSVSLPKSVRKMTLKYAKDQDITVSQVTKDALRNYILGQEWNGLQKAFGPALEKLGIKTEEDVERYFG